MISPMGKCKEVIEAIEGRSHKAKVWCQLMHSQLDPTVALDHAC